MSKDKTQLLLENSNVFEETLNEFSLKSYDLASVNEIIKRSAYNKGSFYYRFKDKQELYISLLDYVFVKQIEAYQSSGFSLVTNDHIKDILLALMNNLIDLYHMDHRFFHLIIRFYNENRSFRDTILKQSIGSLYERFISKLTRSKAFSNPQAIILDSLYKNFPVDGIQAGEIRVEDLVSQIIGDYDSKTHDINPKTPINQFKTKFDQAFTYLVTETFMDKEDDVFDVIDALERIKKVRRRLKRISLQFVFDLKKILIKYQNKPIFNGEAIENLLSPSVWQDVEADAYMYKILTAYSLAILELNSYINIQLDLSKLSDKQANLLLNMILPINGRLSRVILKTPTLVFNSDYFKQFSMLDPLGNLKHYHFDDFKDQYHQKIYCQYRTHDQFHVKYVNKLNDLKALFDEAFDIIDISMIHYIHINDLKKVVSQR